MITVELKNNLGNMIFDSAFPRNDFDTKEQKIDAETGLPIWSVAVLLRQPNSRRSESMTINVPSQKDPNEMFVGFDPIAFDGLRIMTGENDGNKWVSFSADKVGKPGAAPAAK